MLNKKIHNYSFNFYLGTKIKYPNNLHSLSKLCKSEYNIVGNLYSYNDAAIGKNPISIKKFNKILNFDVKKKTIEAEAGILLNDLIDKTLKKKLIIKSLPGSRYVTLGGIIASNTQGKTTKKCFIKDYIISLKVFHNRKVINCSLYQNKKLFLSTIGGKGCTGIIISAKLRLDKIYNSSILLQKIFFDDLNDLKSKFLKLKKKEYLVAWVDNLSTKLDGIIFYASHKQKLPIKIKRKELMIPSIFIYFLNLISSYKIFTFFFNNIFKIQNYLKKKIIYNIFDFFFIQDTLKNWNEVFKKKGFFQFQFRCRFEEMNYIIENLNNIMKKNNIFSNFMIIKFYTEKNKIYNSISLDIIKNSNYVSICKVLNNFSNEFDLNISLSKDSIISIPNNKTTISNNFLNYRKYDKNFRSKFLTRITKK